MAAKAGPETGAPLTAIEAAAAPAGTIAAPRRRHLAEWLLLALDRLLSGPAAPAEAAPPLLPAGTAPAPGPRAEPLPAPAAPPSRLPQATAASPRFSTQPASMPSHDTQAEAPAAFSAALVGTPPPTGALPLSQLPQAPAASPPSPAQPASAPRPDTRGEARTAPAAAATETPPPAAASAPQAPTSPPAAAPLPPTLWLAGEDAAAARLLEGAAPRLAEALPGWRLLVTPGEDSPGPDPGRRGALAAFLQRHRPAAVVLSGNPFRPRLVVGLAQRGIPVIGVAVRAPQRHWLEHPLARPLARRLFARYAVLMAQDVSSLSALRHYGAPLRRAEVGGPLSAPVAVPPGSPAEERSLTELMRGRPLWCAAALPLPELPLVMAAQKLALARSHRLLLVVVPERVEDAPAMQAALAAAGLVSGLRSAGEDPEDELSAYVADIEGELGLWLRLSPVAFQGGTFTAGAPSRTPLESAALGSAILHGPEVAPHASDYARLEAAGAARRVGSAEALAHEVDSLMAPDQAATMAQAGWEIASASEGAAALLASRLAALLGGRVG